MSFAAPRPEKQSRTKSSPRHAALTAYDGHHRQWRYPEQGIESEHPRRSRLRRTPTRRPPRILLLATAVLLGAVIGGLGQYIAASHDLGVAMVELAETMIGNLRSLKGEGLP